MWGGDVAKSTVNSKACNVEEGSDNDPVSPTKLTIGNGQRVAHASGIRYVDGRQLNPTGDGDGFTRLNDQNLHAHVFKQHVQAADKPLAQAASKCLSSKITERR